MMDNNNVLRHRAEDVPPARNFALPALRLQLMVLRCIEPDSK